MIGSIKKTLSIAAFSASSAVLIFALSGNAQSTAPTASTEPAPQTDQSSAADVAPQADRSYQVLFGPGYASSFNLDEYYLNRAKLLSPEWRYTINGKRYFYDEIKMRGYIDEQTNLPISSPIGTSSITAGNILANYQEFAEYYSGDWVFEWDGTAEVNLNGVPKNKISRKSKNRIEFEITPHTANNIAVTFKNLRDGGVKGLRFFRREHEDLLRAGNIFTPDFLAQASRYDIIRMMDNFHTNSSPIRSWSQVATLDSHTWGSLDTRRDGRRSEKPFYGSPYENHFRLGVETGQKIWTHIPLEIGSPIYHYDAQIFNASFTKTVENLRDEISAKAEDILASSEWDHFAENFLTRLVQSGYPEDRPLYIEVGNEVWNFAGGFAINTHYAWGIGAGTANPDRHEPLRWGYGQLTGRWIEAFENAQEKAGVSYNIVYVVGTHRNNGSRTRAALAGVKNYLERNGIDPANIMPRVGVAVTNYWGHRPDIANGTFVSGKGDPLNLLIKAATTEPDVLSARVFNHYINGSGPGSVAWIVEAWRKNKEIAENYGAFFIGGYEGGDHFNITQKKLRENPEFSEWRREFSLEGPGADITKAVNDALIAEFGNGIVIADFGGASPFTASGPWNGEHYSSDNRRKSIWESYLH